MRMRKIGIKLSCFMGMALWLSACAAPLPAPLPRLEEAQTGAKKEVSPGLIPQEYLCAGGLQEAPDPHLVQEIQAFLEENGMLGGVPSGLASDLPMVLNGPVKAYLRVFTTSHKVVFASYLARSGRYLPLMLRIFREHGLPEDLVYLCLVESGFNPWAKSPAEAVGPWQFIKDTAQRYGLRVNGWVDERRDPEKSTRAAAHYLKDLYRQFGCWYLAAAGYNAGEKRVEGTLNRNNTHDFWELAQRRLLPQETCNYVPQLIAAALIAKNPEKHGFQGISYQSPWRAVRVKVPGGVDIRWFAEALAIPFETLRELNPELLKDRTPGDCQEYLLQIPTRDRSLANIVAQICWKEKN